MTKQRKFLLLAAVFGLICMLFPWVTFCTLNFCSNTNGFNFVGLAAGGFVALTFLGTCALSVHGDKSKNLALKQFAITLCCGGTPAAIILWRLNQFVSAYGSSDKLRFGAYLAAMAALAIPLSLFAIWFFKSPQADSQIEQRSTSNT